MLSKTARDDLSSLSPEVLAFAAEREVLDYLPAVLALTRRVFAGWPLRLYVEQDVVITRDWYIVLEVETSLSLADLATARGSWMAEISRHCPSACRPLFLLRAL